MRSYYKYRRKHKVWIVYGLYDARDTAKPFYIGVTHDMTVRLSAHYFNHHQATRKRILQIQAAGAHCVIRSLVQFANREDAGIYERLLIARTPGMLNHRGAFVHTLAKIINNDFDFMPHAPLELPLDYRL